MLEDLRHHVRRLFRRPAFTLAAVATLAVGIGANTAIFSIVDAALLRPYPHIDTDRWAYLYERPSAEGLSRLSVSIPNYRDWKEQGRSFSDMLLWFDWSFTLAGSGAAEPERAPAVVITPDVFTALGAAPAAGRLFSSADAPQVPERRVVISHALWQRRFGGDPDIAGKTIELNLVPFTILGVAPRGFSFPPETPTEIWTPWFPQTFSPQAGRDGRGYRAAGRLARGASFSTAQAELNVVAERLAREYAENKGYGALVVPMRDDVAGDFRAPLLALFGALGLVLMLAAVNLANLQLVRLEARRQEMAVRVALGAGRARIARELLAESLLLAFVAGAAGLLLAPLGVRILLSFVPAEQIPWLSVSIDRRVFALSAALTLAVAIVSGLLPVLRVAYVDPAGTLSRGRLVTDAAGLGRRMRQAFLVAQVALSLAPLIGAALLIQSFVRLQRVDPGFATDHRLTLLYSAPRARYKGPEEIATLAERVGAAVRQIGEVRAAGLAQALPFAPGAIWFQALTRQDPKSIANPADLPHVRYNVVSTGYVEALGVPLKSGRTFDDTDTRDGRPVVVINEALARRYFAGEDPIGQPLWVGHAQALAEAPPRVVIGVIGDVRQQQLDAPAEAAAWVPLSQQSMGEEAWRTLYLIVHTRADALRAVAAVRQRIGEVDKDLALAGIRTMDSRLAEAVWRQRLAAHVLGALGVAALVIATLGVFAIIGFLAARRTREIGVRMALGADRRQILALVLGESGTLVAAGLVLGLAGAWALTRFLSGLLFGVTATDPGTFAVTTAFLAAAALLGCYLPARRAAHLDPTAALRHE